MTNRFDHIIEKYAGWGYGIQGYRQEDLDRVNQVKSNMNLIQEDEMDQFLEKRRPKFSKWEMNEKRRSLEESKSRSGGVVGGISGGLLGAGISVGGLSAASRKLPVGMGVRAMGGGLSAKAALKAAAGGAFVGSVGGATIGSRAGRIAGGMEPIENPMIETEHWTFDHKALISEFIKRNPGAELLSHEDIGRLIETHSYPEQASFARIGAISGGPEYNYKYLGHNREGYPYLNTYDNEDLEPINMDYETALRILNGKNELDNEDDAEAKASYDRSRQQSIDRLNWLRDQGASTFRFIE